MYLNRYRRVILLVLVAIVVSATLAFSGLILGRHVVEVEPGPPVELDYNGSSLVVAAPYSSRLVVEPMRVAGQQLSPCVEYTLSVRAEGLRDYRYLAVLVAGNSSVGLYAEPSHDTTSAMLCAETSAEVAMARSVVVEAGQEKGRLEAVLTARAVDPGKAESGYWPAWAWPGAYAVYNALMGRLEARVLEAGLGYAIVEQRVSDSLGLGLINASRTRVGFDEVNEKLVFYTRNTLEKLLENAARQGCSVEETKIDVAGRKGVEALEVMCPRYTLYVSPKYGLLLRAYAGVYVELEDTNILPVSESRQKAVEVKILPSSSHVYANGTLLLEIIAYQQSEIVKIEACNHALPGTKLEQGHHTLRLQLPSPPTTTLCTIKIYTKTGNVYLATLRIEKSS